MVVEMELRRVRVQKERGGETGQLLGVMTRWRGNRGGGTRPRGSGERGCTQTTGASTTGLASYAQEPRAGRRVSSADLRVQASALARAFPLFAPERLPTSTRLNPPLAPLRSPACLLHLHSTLTGHLSHLPALDSQRSLVAAPRRAHTPARRVTCGGDHGNGLGGRGHPATSSQHKGPHT